MPGFFDRCAWRRLVQGMPRRNRLRVQRGLVESACRMPTDKNDAVRSTRGLIACAPRAGADRPLKTLLACLVDRRGRMRFIGEPIRDRRIVQRFRFVPMQRWPLLRPRCARWNAPRPWLEGITGWTIRRRRALRKGRRGEQRADEDSAALRRKGVHDLLLVTEGNVQ